VTDEIKPTSTIAQTIILILVIGGVTASVWFGFPLRTPTSTTAPRNIELAGMTTTLARVPQRGNSAARVVVIEFSDFQCHFCGRFATGAQPELVAKYVDTGAVAWAFRHLPLTQIHPHAVRAAETAECAGRQGRFWEAHDALFRDQQVLAAGHVLVPVQSLVGNRAALADCVNQGEARDRVAEDLKEATRLGLRTTPVFMLGIRQPDGTVKISTALRGAGSAIDFGHALDALLAR
jgi:protein-disulfide isomerase